MKEYTIEQEIEFIREKLEDTITDLNELENKLKENSKFGGEKK